MCKNCLLSMILSIFIFCGLNALEDDYRNKRLLIVSDIEEGAIGGTEKVIEEIRGRLKKRGMEVFLLDNTKLDTFTMPLTGGTTMPYPGKIKKKIAQTIEIFKPNYILIIPLGIMGYKAGSYCFKNKIPFSVFYSVRMPELCKTLFYIPKWITRYFINRLLSRSSGIFVPTLSFKEELDLQGLDNVYAWPHGINLNHFYVPTVEEKIEARANCDLHGLPRPFYLYVGHLSKAKNLDAFLKLDVPGTKIAVGDSNIGYNLDQLRVKYPEIIFPGPRMGKDLLSYYQAADIFLFPGKNDSFGIVLLEALAVGLPIVGFNTYGPGDVVPMGCGVSYLADRDEELKECAIRAWEDLKSGEVDARMCREYVSKYSWDKAIDQLLSKLVFI